MTIEMEVYYGVFDRAVRELYEEATEEALYTRRALLKVPIKQCTEFEFGDPVAVRFRANGDQLVFAAVVANEISADADTGLVLMGLYEGQDVTSGRGHVGFELNVTHAEFAATEYTEGITMIIRSHFRVVNRGLVFDHLDVARELNQEPIMFK